MNGIDIMKDILLTCKSFWVFYILKYKVKYIVKIN